MKFIIFTYLFSFGILFKVQGANLKQQQPKDCVKHHEIVKRNNTKQIDKSKTAAIAKIAKLENNTNSVLNFSLFNVINFFYAKDTLNNLRVM